MHALIHSASVSLNQRFISLVIQSLMDSLIVWFIDSLIHWVIDLSIHWFTGWLVHWLLGSLSHCFVAPLIHELADSLIDWFIVHCFFHSVVHGFFHVMSLASQQPFANSLMHLTTSTLHGFFIAKKSFRSLISFSHVLFSKLPPGAGRARSGICIYLYNFLSLDIENRG